MGDHSTLTRMPDLRYICYCMKTTVLVPVWILVEKKSGVTTYSHLADMSTSFTEALYIENISKVTPKSLAEYLVKDSPVSWRRVEVVFLYGSLKSKHPLCAAVSIPGSLKAACLAKHNSILLGDRLKIVEWRDCHKIRSARWILTSDQRWISVVGSKHWATNLELPAERGLHTENAVGDGCNFYDWRRVPEEREGKFCYAVVDCGMGLKDRVKGEQELHSVVQKAFEAGVQRLVVKGNSIKKAERAKELAAEYPGFLGFTVGYHPDNAGAWFPDKLEKLEELLQDSACVAVGECGLNGKANTEEQVKLFKLQVELACRTRKPLLVVDGGAQCQILEILKHFHGRLPPVAIRSDTPENCDFNLYIQQGFNIVVTGKMFKTPLYNSPFFTWLRSTKPWQRDYLLLASNAYDIGHYPEFVEKVLLGEGMRIIQQVNRANYSAKALYWFEENHNYKQKPGRPFFKCCSTSTPLLLPILVELVADGLGIPASEFAQMCLENSKRFFQVVKKTEKEVVQPEKKVVQERGWEQTKFWLPLTVSLAAVYCSLRSLEEYFVTLHDWFRHLADSVWEMS